MNRERTNILLVASDLAEARLLRTALRGANALRCTLTHARRLADALKRLGAGGIDVVVLDLALPDGGGLEAVARMRAAAPGVPIVVLATPKHEALARKAIRRGAHEYLPKGELDGRSLARTIRYAIERARAEQALSESEERYALVARGANDGLWDWNLKTNEAMFSPRWKSMLGFEAGEIGQDPDEWLGRVHPEDLEPLKAKIAAHLDGLTPECEHEYRVLHRDGTYRWMRSRGVAVRDAGGQASRMAGSQTDITDRKQTEERLLHDAFHDALTGLPNRALFMDRLGRALERAKRREDYLFAVLLMDVDRFKVVNDSLGPMVGDQLLVAIARRLEAGLRTGDTIARLGGDEFAILLDDIRDVSDATRVAERLNQKLVQPFTLMGQEVYATVSIGIAVNTRATDRPEDLLRDADAAMYRAKGLGKARHEMFDPDLHLRALSRLQLEADLRRAIERKEFLVHFQPSVSLQTGKMTGAETLVRWQHPQRGLVSPSEFIPVAEETGLILAIGEWALRTACAQTKAWHDAGHAGLRVAVNFSARQFQHPSLPDLIRDVLKETGLPARALDLEITESTAMRNVDESIKMLNELTAMGMQISIDDFGTGYSSLGTLKRFPIHTLKIDQSFVRGIPSDPDDSALTIAIIALAHSLKFRVIAEGVETDAQLAFLRSHQCDEMQGYLFSPPIPAAAFTKLVQEGRCLALDPS